jgi:hypothetical protein
MDLCQLAVGAAHSPSSCSSGDYGHGLPRAAQRVIPARGDGEVCLIRTNAVRLAFRCRQPPASIVEAGQKHDPGFETVGICRMSGNRYDLRTSSRFNGKPLR